MNAILCDAAPHQGAWSDDEYRRGAAASSPLLAGFAADVAAVFDAPVLGAG